MQDKKFEDIFGEGSSIQSKDSKQIAGPNKQGSEKEAKGELNARSYLGDHMILSRKEIHPSDAFPLEGQP